MPTNLFIQRQLQYIQQQVITQDFPEYLMASGQFLPVDSSIPAGAQTYSYKILTFVGSAAILANGADDIPLVNAYAEERIGRVKTLTTGYAYTVEDMEAAQFANTNLDSQMAVGARQVLEQKFDALAYTGDSNFSLLGIIGHPNVPSYTVPNNGTGSTTTWSTKTAANIYADLRNFASETRSQTNGVETIEAIAMPVEQFDLISGTPYPDNTTAGETILSFFLKTQRASQGGVQTVFPDPRLNGAGTGGADIMVGFRKRADKVRLHMPMDFTMEPVQVKGLNYTVPCRMRTGGVQVLKPYSIRYAEGI